MRRRKKTVARLDIEVVNPKRYAYRTVTTIGPKKIFISSTVHDLKDLRGAVSDLLNRNGFQVVMSDKGSVPVDSKKHSYSNCIVEAENCDVLVAIIGGRYGGEYRLGKSITQAEIEAAFDSNKRVIVFVKRDIVIAGEILKPYMAKKDFEFIESKVVEDVRVFKVIQDLQRRTTGNWMFHFYDFAELAQTLAHQLEFKIESGFMRDIHDKAIAETFLNSFPTQSLERFTDGVQVGKVLAKDATAIYYGLQFTFGVDFAFINKRLSKSAAEFRRHVRSLHAETINSFIGSERDDRVYVRIRQPGLDTSIRRTSTMAVHVMQAWQLFLHEIRTRWPELLLPLVLERKNASEKQRK